MIAYHAHCDEIRAYFLDHIKPKIPGEPMPAAVADPALPKIALGQVWKTVDGRLIVVCEFNKAQGSAPWLTRFFDEKTHCAVTNSGWVGVNHTYNDDPRHEQALCLLVAESVSEYCRFKDLPDTAIGLGRVFEKTLQVFGERSSEKLVRRLIDETMSETAARAGKFAAADPALRLAMREEIERVIAPRELVVRRQEDGVVTGRVAGAHARLEEALRISQAINNLWLCGPAGSGKTTLAGQLAHALGRQFSFISCTTGMSESKLLGRMNVHGTYLPADFVRVYEEGGVFLWDEFDAADPNVVLCANAAMANGRLSVPDRVEKPVAERHPDTILIIATNTWGRGGNTEYSARETIDAATRDRFALSKILVEYSPTIEWSYLGTYQHDSEEVWMAPALSTLTLPQAFAKIRANIVKHTLRRVLSTRCFQQGAALRAAGFSDQQILGRLFVDWTKTEREKALEGVA